jgi:large conductance mechanosensitive channel
MRGAGGSSLIASPAWATAVESTKCGENLAWDFKEQAMLKEFKEFAMRGSVIDLAVGVVIGAAFGKIVTSLVDDVIMPPIGQLVGHVDFSNLFIALGRGHYESLADAKAAHVATLNYGMFVNNVVNFLIVAFTIFIVVYQVNRWTKKPAPPAAPTTKDCPQCTMAIPIAAKRCPQCTSQLA